MSLSIPSRPVDAVQLNQALEWIGSNRLKACCFDFGGTLHDFTPIHIRAFCSALGIDDSQDGSAVGRIVRLSLADGLDSVHMAQELIREYGAGSDPTSLAVRKRWFVEKLIAADSLCDEIVSFLIRVSEVAQFSVITRGLQSSTSSILARSLPACLRERILVLGRSDLIERPNKEELLRKAIDDMHSPMNSSCYLGDSCNDGIVAARANIRFFHLVPFDGVDL